LGIPADMLPLLIVRPISGSGALALTGDLLRNYGPDNPMGLLASILQGATDTTFFVVTLYFGSVGIKKYRHAVASCLIGDICGFLTGFYLWNKFMH
jgi:spore maturation protein B